MLEKDVHIMVCEFIRQNYPKVLFRSDFSSGMKMSIGMARRHKALQSSRAFPDLFIIEPRGGFNGLFIELKRVDAIVYNKDGSLRKDKHLEEQSKMLEELENRGFLAVFGQGYKDTIQRITSYLEGY
jgi:hypothetical protein